ncbi:S8 family peptidase [Alkalihalophilus pseudofirmus]|uniref:S8 family peptidase n=1 Tax=Alkalihalophilus pseudofirmus TaxID=79885 RepID=A0AAJ2KUJ8_ALKPS|nr:S8 family peptidase [Alkalihalophilus pseudofirmus]MDV2884123.1 S8 family peptidase [Alkalihalophilus pseudofirmus]
MWRMAKTVAIVAVVGLALAMIGRALIDDNQIAIQSKEIPKKLETNAMDQLMAQDLALTTSMFLKQLSSQLQRWGDADLTDSEIQKRFSEEVQEHPHFNGFALLKDDQPEIIVGDMSTSNSNLLTHHHMNSEFSDPYEQDGKMYMLMGEKSEGGHTILGEVDLSFVKAFIRNTAAVADSNGNFFVSGDNPNIDWKTTADLPESIKAETVPELGWQIAVQSQQPDKEKLTYVEHQAVIKFKRPQNNTAWFTDNQDLTVVKQNDPFYVVKSETETTEALIQRLRRDYDLAFAEPNYVFTQTGITPQSTVPNDEFFADYQWNLEQIEMSEGWNLSGGKDVTIAILDTGVDPEHQDLKDKLLTGFNAFDESSDHSDAHGHGTHVAGVAAALTNNVTGIAGVSWHSKILPVKVLNDNGEGSSYEVAKGIYWAVDNGADVINMSLGDYYHADVLQDAVRYAYENDVVLIAASGNDNVEDPMYPAQYEEVLTVAAVDDTRNRAFFSNYGQHIDVAAPGAHIPSLFPNNQYTVMSGTSMASPHVAGLAGLIRAMRPDLNVEQVYDVIRNTARDLGTEGHDAYYGHGEIDVANALESLTGR